MPKTKELLYTVIKATDCLTVLSAESSLPAHTQAIITQLLLISCISDR